MRAHLRVSTDTPSVGPKRNDSRATVGGATAATLADGQPLVRRGEGAGGYSDPLEGSARSGNGLTMTRSSNRRPS